MASEAERLIGISLTKIAQSRSHRGGVSLHKNLLVATVLQKARYIFMEEAYNMVHYQTPTPVQISSRVTAAAAPQEDLVGLTPEEAGYNTTENIQEASSGSSSSNSEYQQPTCVKCAENQSNQDKENHPPYNSDLTYLDLDKSSNVLKERSNSLKRRRAVTEWETEEAVQSILPKKSKQEDSDNSDSVFLDDSSTLLSDTVSKEINEEKSQQQPEGEENSTGSGNGASSSMEIDRITSLVSIFSFSMGDGKLNRSMSTPDLCSTQAKDNPDSLQQRQFIAMTV